MVINIFALMKSMSFSNMDFRESHLLVFILLHTLLIVLNLLPWLQPNMVEFVAYHYLFLELLDHMLQPKYHKRTPVALFTKGIHLGSGFFLLQMAIALANT